MMPIDGYEKGSIESIAAVKWEEYGGDVGVMKDVERTWGEDAYNMVVHALSANFIEGFRQGVLLRLTGESNEE
jgi:hypothetical protein